MGNIFSRGSTRKVHKTKHIIQMDLSQSTPELTEDQTSPSHSMTSLPSHRVFHNIEASTYWLPKDEEEQERLTVQHLAIKELYNGNVLTSTFDYVNLEENCRVLDVGCGSGIWAMDMAMAYPKSEFIGVDIADVRVQNIELDNVTFGHGNVLERLDFPDNSFDLVHMRLFVLALREDEWPGAVREAFRLVKPGGVLHLMEYDILVNGNEIVRKGMQAVQDTCRDRGQDPNIALQIERLASEAGGKVVQTDYRLVQFTNQTNLGKNFVWDWKQGFKSGMKLLGPKLGLETPEDQKKFLEEISVGMATSGATVGLNGVVARKPL